MILLFLKAIPIKSESLGKHTKKPAETAGFFIIE
jgi:hypothetical protein